MQELFKKYVDNQCSPEEVKELLGNFNNPENEALLRGLILDSLVNFEADDDGTRRQPVTEKTFVLLKKQLHNENGYVVPFFRKNWFRVAAAVLFLVSGYAIFKSAKSTIEPKQELVQTHTSSHEIIPGSNRAVLTLADGSTIVLDKAADGALVQQGNTTISKMSNGILVYKLNEKPGDVLFNSITTPRGGQYQLILADGTKVWLNAASTLRFPAAFAGGERKVEIIGEGYFEVAKNALMPFKVTIADKTEVVVLGTQFNINAYGDETTTNTTLIEGRVKITGLGTRHSRLLAPGQQAQINKSGQITLNKNADTEQAMAWKNGVFNFNNADLGTVFRQLSRWYDVDIEFEGPIPQRQFNGEMQRDMNLSQVLRLLEKNNVYCRMEGKKIIVLK